MLLWNHSTGWAFLIPKTKIWNFQNINISWQETLLHIQNQLRLHTQGIHETNKLHAYNWAPSPRCSSNTCEYSKIRKISNLKRLNLSIAGKGDLSCSSQSCVGWYAEGTNQEMSMSPGPTVPFKCSPVVFFPMPLIDVLTITFLRRPQAST